MTPAARQTLAVAVLALGSLMTACVESNRPAEGACAAPSVELELTLTESALTPDDPAVCRGQVVTLRVESAVDGVLHVHGYDDELPAAAVSPGENELEFAAARSGQFSIELHTDADPQGVSVGILTVHDP